jgi:hypothetical protein
MTTLGHPAPVERTPTEIAAAFHGLGGRGQKANIASLHQFTRDAGRPGTKRGYGGQSGEAGQHAASIDRVHRGSSVAERVTPLLDRVGEVPGNLRL